MPFILKGSVSYITLFWVISLDILGKHKKAFSWKLGRQQKKPSTSDYQNQKTRANDIIIKNAYFYIFLLFILVNFFWQIKIFSEKIFVVFAENFGHLYNTKFFFEKNTGLSPHNSELDNNICIALFMNFIK